MKFLSQSKHASLKKTAPFFIILFLSFLFILFTHNAHSQGIEIQGVNGRCGDTVTCACGDQVNATRTLTSSDSVVTGTCTGIGLNISADNVLLDCAGFTITGDGGTTNDNALLIINRKNVTIKNCRFIGFGESSNFNGAVSLSASNGTLLSNLTVFVPVANAEALYLTASTNTTTNQTNLSSGVSTDILSLQAHTRFSTFSNTLLLYNFSPSGASALRMDDNGFNTFSNLTIEASCAGCRGIVLDASSNNTFVTGTSITTTTAPLILGSTSNNNTFVNFVLNSTTSSAIDLSEGSIVTSNSGFDNSFINFSINTTSGTAIEVASDSRLHILNTLVRTQGGTGVAFTSTAQNNTLKDNRFFTGTGISLSFSGTTAIEYNHSIDVSNIEMDNNLSIYYLGPKDNGIVIDGKHIGALYIFFSKNHIIKNNNLTKVEEALFTDSDNLTVWNNSFQPNLSGFETLEMIRINNSLFYNNNFTIGSTVSANEAVLMTTGRNNTFENTTIQIYVTGGQGMEINTRSKFNIVKNLTITPSASLSSTTGFILATGSGYNTVENLTIEPACSSCYGLVITDASNNTFEKARIITTISTPLGIGGTSNNNTFRYFVLNTTSAAGVDLNEGGCCGTNAGTNNVFINLSINTTSGIAFDIGADSNATLTNSTLRTQGGTGVAFTSTAQNNTLKDNIFFTGTGISLSFSGTTAIEYNHSIDVSNIEMDNNLSIYYLGPKDNGIVIDGKHIGALYIFFSKNHIIKNNNLTKVEEVLFSDDSNLTILNNSFISNISGFEPVEMIRVNNSLFANNNITFTSTTAGDEAILVTGVRNTTFENNMVYIYVTSGIGFLINTNARFNTFRNTNVTFLPSLSSGTGIRLFSGSGFNFFENTTIYAACSSCYGILLSAVSNNTFDRGNIFTTTNRPLAMGDISTNNTFKNLALNSTTQTGIELNEGSIVNTNNGFSNKFINISINTTSGTGITLSGTNETFQDIIIRSDTGTGIDFPSGVSYNYTTFERIIIEKTTGTGLIISLGNHTFKDIWINSSSSSCTTASGCDIRDRSISSSSTHNFTNLTLITPQVLVLDTDYTLIFTNLTLENVTAKLLFPNVSFTSFAFNLQNNLTLRSNFSFVNSTRLSPLNTSAQITFRNLIGTNFSAFVDPEDDGTFTLCPSTRCTNTQNSFATFIFNVSSWTAYSAQALLPGPVLISTTELNGSVKNQNFILVNVTVLNGISVTSYNFTFANATSVNTTTFDITNQTATFNFSLSGIANSTFLYNVTVNGTLGVNTTETRVIIIDTNIPFITLDNPVQGYNTSTNNLNFTCSTTDNSGLSNLTLFTNITGTFNITEVSNISGLQNSTAFNVTSVNDGRYLWTCRVKDGTNTENFGENRTVTVDTTSPSLSLTSDKSSLLTDETATLTCSATDNLEMKSVVISETSAGVICSGISTCSGTYTSLISGTKTFTCLVKDYVDNPSTSALSVPVLDSSRKGGQTSPPGAPSSSDGIPSPPSQEPRIRKGGLPPLEQQQDFLGFTKNGNLTGFLSPIYLTHLTSSNPIYLWFFLLLLFLLLFLLKRRKKKHQEKTHKTHK